MGTYESTTPEQKCIFCRIIARTATGTIVYEDDAVLAIVPIDQVSKGHTLVIPKSHAENILDIENESLEKVILVTKKLSKELLVEHGATGINVLHAAGLDAQQSVFHLHFHIVPRYPNDGLDLWPRNNL